MTADLLCPDCRAEFDPVDNGPPTTGSVSVCLDCGYLGVWSGQRWTPPDAEQRAMLLAQPKIVEALVRGQETAEWRRTDETAMAEVLLAAMVDAPDGISAKDWCADLARHLVQRHGFHRHPGDQ